MHGRQVHGVGRITGRTAVATAWTQEYHCLQNKSIYVGELV